MGLKAHKGERLRFITLTTAPDMKRDLSSAFRALKERIRRRYRFEYLKIETSEGQNGVLHILYFGSFIPQQWLSKIWKEITGTAYIVDIRACKGRTKNEKRLASYCVSQYCSGQSKYVRYSWSWGWCFKGFVKWFKFFIRELGFQEGIRTFDLLLSGHQVSLRGYVFKPPPNFEVSEIIQTTAKMVIDDNDSLPIISKIKADE